MVHDIALEKLDLKSTQILDKGATASITFKAKSSDTYFCSLPGHRAAGMEGRLEVTDTAPTVAPGTAPEVNGRPLNLDFESGTLENWTATGDAFQVVQGDGLSEAGPGQASVIRGHSGTYWVSSGVGGSARKGTLTSVPFKVTQPYASFFVSGGAFQSTRVEIVTADDKKTIYTITGADHARLRPAVVDLQAYVGQGHLRSTRRRRDGRVDGDVHPRESLGAHQLRSLPVLRDAALLPERDRPRRTSARCRRWIRCCTTGLSAAEAAQGDDRAEGIHRQARRRRAGHRQADRLHARRSRPAVGRRGAHLSGARRRRDKGRDRILIFEDTDGDGRLDSRKVFIEGLNLVSGIEVGFGGVWVGAAPNLLFIPIKKETDQPAGPPQVLLDGWGYQDTHETLNTFSWGPDGWLYGTHGVFTHSNVGKPGAPDSERQRLNGAIWRYHPTTHDVRGVRRGHEQSVGPRLQRLRPRLHDRVRHPAPLPRHPGRALQAPGRPALQPVHLRRHQDHRRPRALGRARRARTPATADRMRPAAATRTPAR